MPAIPKYNRQETIKTPRAMNVVSGGPELSRAGKELENIATIQQNALIRQKAAERALKALKMENGLRNDIDTLADSFSQRTDYETWDAEIDEGLKDIEQKWKDYAGDDRVISMAFQKAFENNSFTLKSTLRDKKYDLMNKDALREFDILKQNSLKEYAIANTPQEREIISNNFQLSGYELVDKGVIGADQIEDKINAFDTEAETERAEMLIEFDPELAKKLLANESDEFDLNPDNKGDLRRKAREKIKEIETQNRIAKNEAKQKEKERLKQVHDDYEKNVGLEFINGNYTVVWSLINEDASPLTGDEVKTWSDAIDKAMTEKIDPQKNAVAIVEINDMISKGENPDKIRNYAIQNPSLGKEDKEQYINKLEAGLIGEVDEGRKTGYKDIYDIIVPKRGPEAKILETSLEIQKVKLAQMQLDTWIDEQKKADKILTKNEIRTKALELAQDNRPTLAEKINFMKKYAAELKQEKELQK